MTKGKHMRLLRFGLMGFCALCLGLAVASCRSGGQGMASVASATPVVVSVADFSVNPHGVETDQSLVGGVMDQLRGGDTPTAGRAVDLFSEALVAELRDAGIPAQRLSAGTPPPPRGWLVRGRFTSLKEGHSGVQGVVGFGAGNPEVQVVGEVVDLDLPGQPRVMVIGDMADGRPMPGGLISRTPAVIVLKALRASGSFEREVENLAETVATAIIEEMRGLP